MKGGFIMKRLLALLACAAVLSSAAVALPSNRASAYDYSAEFPQEDAWTEAIPSVVWNGDPASTTTLKVHIVSRKDIKRVWITSLGTGAPEGRGELYDDGTHGDAKAGDRVFTLADVALPAEIYSNPGRGFHTWWGFIRVELLDGTTMGNEYGMIVGLADQEYKNRFPVRQYGKGLSATPYAFFIKDTGHQVMDGYPVAGVYCGTKNFKAYKKLYSVFPDVFDFALLMPGMQIFRPKDLRENVPYNVTVSNMIKNIGMPRLDDTARFGSSGKLKSVQYESFASYEVSDHETAHNWGAFLGKNLGLMEKQSGGVISPHWNSLSDIGGQLGYYYINGDKSGHFAYNGDGTWRFLPNTYVSPYSPLELYVMGLIPPSEVPDIHILKNPDLTDLNRITAESFKTITMKQIVKAAGGERIPSAADAQKDFAMAFIVTQDRPYDEAAYAFFSLISRELMNREPPREHTYFAPFYWATGGRATLSTFLGDYETLVPAEQAGKLGK
jgi:hypothetical protein